MDQLNDLPCTVAVEYSDRPVVDDGCGYCDTHGGTPVVVEGGDRSFDGCLTCLPRLLTREFDRYVDLPDVHEVDVTVYPNTIAMAVAA